VAQGSTLAHDICASLASGPSGGSPSPDETSAAGSHHVGAEAVLVTNDFGPGVVPVALPVNPAAGLVEKSARTRGAGGRNVPAMRPPTLHRTRLMYQGSPARGD